MSSDYGVKIALPGYDVNTATPEQCSLHSGFANTKIKTNASPAHFNLIDYTFGSNPGVGTLNIATIAHGYSYTPMALVYVQDVAGFLLTAGRYASLPVSAGPLPDARFVYYTDGTNLKIDLVVNVVLAPSISGYRFKFKYYLFAENG